MVADNVLVMLRGGLVDGPWLAKCEECPFSTNGGPTRPVLSEHPVDPAWLIVAESPGHNEIRLNRVLIGASGQVVNKVLQKIGRRREEIYLGNALLCMPIQGVSEVDRHKAAICCKPRLLAELAQFPGKPILTLGAIAARAVIPQSVLDTVDPPETPRGIKKIQKLRQAPMLKNVAARRSAINKETTRRLRQLVAYQRKQIITDIKTRYRKRPDNAYIDQEITKVHARLLMKARENAIKAVDLKAQERALKKKIDIERPKKVRKPKPVKITDIVGTLFDIDVDGSGIRPLIPAIHPAALLRGGGASIMGSHTPDLAFINLIYDAAKIDNLAKGKDIRLHLDIAYEVKNTEQAQRLFLAVYRSALAESSVSLDLETYVDDPDRHNALMAYMARIRVIGLATKEMTVSLAWDLLPAWCMSCLQHLFSRVELTTHNGLYDRTVLRAHGFILPSELFTDSLLAHHAGFPGNAHRLQTVTAQFFGVGPWKSEYRNSEETPEKLALYCARDTGATHALRAPLMIHVKRTQTERVYALDKKMAEIASGMHIAGMPVDREANSELLATFSKGVSEARRSVEDTARNPKLREQIWHHLALQQASKKRKMDPDDFEDRYNRRLSAMKLDPDWKWKIGAGKHIAALLLAMGVGLYQTTDKGEITTKKEVLESLTDVPIVRDILAFRENDKLLSTFIWAIFDRKDSKTGAMLQYGFADDFDRIHPIWNVHRITGRWASQWPVVSNVPKDKWKKLVGDALAIVFGLDLPSKGHLTLPSGIVVRKNKDDSVSKLVRPNLRRQIKAPPGRIFVGFDYSQIESRVIALISGDPFLCAIFAEGRDPHIECSRIIWPHFDTLDPDTRKQLRENVKNVEYGYMYMAQLETLHKTMLKAGNMIKLADLAMAIGKLAKAMPGVARWQHATIVQASQPPFQIKDFVLGRTRTWPMGQAEGPEAVNFGVQTAAASIMNTGMANMTPRLDAYKQAFPIAQIHDACVFECWEDDAARLSVDINMAFEQEYERDGRKIPFPVEVRIGQDWASV